MGTATITIEPYGTTRAVYLRDRGAVHVLFAAEESLPRDDQVRACDNVRAAIVRAVLAGVR